MLLSIIIPAYNVEKYIASCLDSCLAQASPLPIGQRDMCRLYADEIEIIVVDDGSTDTTPSILASYAAMHPCIQILHQANQGQSVARNLAIESAHGQYIYMVDSDDRMIAPQADAPSVLPIEQMRLDHYDIIGLQVSYQPEQGNRRPWSHQMERWPFGREYASGADFLTSHNIEGLVYGYVFRRQLLHDHPELRFTPGIYHQDEELIFKIFTLAGPTIYLRTYTYIYYEHTGSSLNTRTAQRRRKLLDDYVVIMHRLTEWSNRFGQDAAATQRLHAMMHYKFSYLAMDLLRYVIRHGYDDATILNLLSQLRSLSRYPLPWLAEPKFLMMKLLTCHPRLVCWWARHETIKRAIGF